MSEWREVSLGEITNKIGSGATPKGGGESYKDSGISLIRSQNILDFKFSTNGLAFIDDSQAYELRNVSVEANDVLLNITGDSVARCCVVPENILPARVNQHVAIIRADKKIADNHYIFYSLQALKEELLMQSEIGATRNALTKGMLENLKISIPALEEQKAIASILSSLDDKIDLLHRQNTTLERMAETLFRQWFAEEAQEDWKEVALGDVATVQNGYAFSSSDYVEFQEGFLEVFKMGHIQPGGGLRFNPKADFVPRIEKLKRWTLNKNDIVMAMTDMKDNMGILGHPALIDVSDKYVLNQRVARIYLESTEKLKSIYLLYLQLNTEEAISLLQSKANSGVQVNLTTEAIKSIPVSLPPESVQDKVLSNIEPIFDKLSSNRMAVKTLEKLRDNLLPKLMGGEVKVVNV